MKEFLSGLAAKIFNLLRRAFTFSHDDAKQTRRLVIMAKSAKNKHFCVAGLTDDGKWLRPVSADSDSDNAVPKSALTYADGSEVQILDVVEIKIKGAPVKNFVQPENFYYDEKYPWRKIGRLPLNKIIKWRGFDDRRKIFYNGERAVEVSHVAGQFRNESLLFLHVTDLTITVARLPEQTKFFASFNYNGRRYLKFGVGDISVRERFKNHRRGEYKFRGEADVTLSLTNPYSMNNKCYKMVAQIF